MAIFLVSLPGQVRFGVAWTTLSAVFTMYLFGLVHLALIGTYYFVDAYIPIAVFLGMHLLVTDPATSPRTAPGRVVFGAAYALSVIALYGLLGSVGAPQFYDKLLGRAGSEPPGESSRGDRAPIVSARSGPEGLP